MELTTEEADKMQEWAGMDGAIAWHLIDRHADNWNEAGEMMNAWLRANGGGQWISCSKTNQLDAERYRLLRKGQHWSVIDGIGDTLSADVLDDAVDAAMNVPPNAK